MLLLIVVDVWYLHFNKVESSFLYEETKKEIFNFLQTSDCTHKGERCLNKNRDFDNGIKTSAKEPADFLGRFL